MSALVLLGLLLAAPAPSQPAHYDLSALPPYRPQQQAAGVGLMGHRTWHSTLEAFEGAFGYAPLEIKFANGSYDDPEGSTPGLMFVVHKSNPLAGLTLDQIDGIFGAQRTGAWVGTRWSTAAARGSEKNIRTWGQLGLAGEWADKPIH